MTRWWEKPRIHNNPASQHQDEQQASLRPAETEAGSALSLERAFCNTYIGTYANRKRVALQLHQQATIENLKISLDASSLIIADEINPHRFQERSSSRNTTEAMHMIPHAYNTFRKYSTETTKPSLVEDD
uniref:Uncharacterized protein n=1 Tax=Coccidioides posadasii RMSCC 3488 TaxID=454284 RepID=A0A0J6IL94_COCPO|nr:hypothetical protein CPAG_09024 [Coccidioides posadasii RMSCC 3488]